MTQGFYEIIYNEKIAKNVYKMVLAGDTSAITAPGQFVNLKLEGKFLRRPISICDWDSETITLIYKVVGEGTEQMSGMTVGQMVDTLVGGGVGVPPLFGLAKKLIAEGKSVSVVLGFNTADEVFLECEFEALGATVVVATADGSYGLKGFVTDAMKEMEYSYFFTCGPMPMFKAIESIVTVSGQYSFEERMGCGFGACMGCTCKTKYGNKRICKDGPVLTREEIVW